MFHYATASPPLAPPAVADAGWARQQTLAPCLASDWPALAFPLSAMQPAPGTGVAASRTPRPVRARLLSLLTHTVFGYGLSLAASGAAALADCNAPLGASAGQARRG